MKTKKTNQELINKFFKNGSNGVELFNRFYLNRKLDCKNATFYWANFDGANFDGANFNGANFYRANFDGANFDGANFNGANFDRANLNYIVNECTHGIIYECPKEGAFIGYKKAKNNIVVIEIKPDSLRSSATTKKCRCSKAKVLRIENIDGSASVLSEISSDYDETFIYKIGEIVEVSDFDTNRWNECSSGIHFFIDRQIAVNNN
ncbi:DUF5758 domain-containing protein [Massilibacteroides sp.]|uniref:pentapeptide repeat-containing protein n=1 Tax=Massilibacteroides sp. TaxID=2034766 RepID=UPI0026386E6C|nr:DUF5758 domain-containing protein [Massilibacteroides sp.]MDD4515676.1 DUF5758 domain-containing protein [Massilibacteroides sp.]